MAVPRYDDRGFDRRRSVPQREDWSAQLEDAFGKVVERKADPESLKGYCDLLRALRSPRPTGPAYHGFFRHLVDQALRHLVAWPGLSRGHVGDVWEEIADELSDSGDEQLRQGGAALHGALADAMEGSERNVGDPSCPHERAMRLTIEASALVEEGCEDDAVKALRLALSLDPDATAALMTLALLLADQGALAEAATHLLHLAELTPQDPRIQLFLGRIRLDQNLLREAHVHLRQALELDPHDPEVWYRLSVCARKAGRIDEARQLYNQFRDRAEDPPLSWVLRSSLRVEGADGMLLLDDRDFGPVPELFDELLPGPREVEVRGKDFRYTETLMLGPGQDYVLELHPRAGNHRFREAPPFSRAATGHELEKGPLV